ncbi:MAG: 5-formyltetrahydrofolate cyclo-ligase [Clostridia bacterium]|nr:5-formyltetrahydrofolate cyclo-ligase [Clostridia bacterium]
MNKQELRKDLRNKRNCMQNIELLSQKITQQILKAEWFLQAKTVLLYRSAKNEVMTDCLWQAAKQMGKTCLFPKCISKTEMIAVLAENEADFSSSAYGIMEPVSNLLFPKENIDLVIVPGLGFDKQKYRIGYGAGYYDRYLEGFSGVTCGLCYDTLLCETVFPDFHDVKLSYVATENCIF